jgi:Ser/Thr protein kinase RdoA (MazF antagonist)
MERRRRGSAYDRGPLTRFSLDDELASLGLRELRRIVGGWQSLAVYAGHLDGHEVAVKVFDPKLVDRGRLLTRLDVLVRLGEMGSTVCVPVPVSGQLVNDLATRDGGLVHAVAYVFAAGVAPDIGRTDDAREMGRVLARLHAAMAALPRYDLPGLTAFPPMSELGAVAGDLGLPAELHPPATVDDGPLQLLHGDFSSKNVRVGTTAWRIFDFDDCGYGPIQHDLANSLYYALFGSMTTAEPGTYHRFRSGFLEGYREQAGSTPSEDVLDALITRRVLRLATWLAHPRTAPPGIRDAPDEWRDGLAAFVQRYITTLTGPRG